MKIAIHAYISLIETFILNNFKIAPISGRPNDSALGYRGCSNRKLYSSKEYFDYFIVVCTSSGMITRKPNNWTTFEFKQISLKIFSETWHLGHWCGRIQSRPFSVEEHWKTSSIRIHTILWRSSQLHWYCKKFQNTN